MPTQILKPLKSGGLWLPVTWMPPSRSKWKSEKYMSGVKVTGSHNPPDFNGFKICVGKSTIHGEQIQELRARIARNAFASGQGRVISRDVIELYQDHLAG